MPELKNNNIQGITPSTWFSPLQPLPNFAPDSVAGRQWDFPVGYNVQITPRPLSKITFPKLRSIYRNCDIMQTIVNSRKDQISSKAWCIKYRDGSDAEQKKKAKDDPRIKEMTDFWRKPDRVNTWDMWMRPWLEDSLVIDAPALYVRRTMGGGIYSVEYMDGGTIALNIDQNGRRPQPPSPAFKQILKRVPAVSYTTDHLVYMPRNLSTDEIFGRSPIEMTMVTINAAINRAQFNANYYTDGNVPDAIAGLPETFTPAQAAQFTEWWDSMYAGNLATRRRVKFVPGKADFTQLKEPELKNVYDDYIARILCHIMGMSPQPFIAEMNRATAETAKDASQETGAAAIENSVKNVINTIIQGPQFFNYPDLEFDYEAKEDTDPKEVAEILDKYVRNGTYSYDEAREQLGKEPRGGLSAEPGIVTASGFITLEQAAAQNEKALQEPDMGVGGGTDGKPSLGASTGKPATEKRHIKKKVFTSLRRYTIAVARRKVAENVYKTLRKTAASVRTQLEKMLKSDEITLDLSDLDGIDADTRAEIADIAGESGRLILGELGFSDGDMFNQVDDRAVEWATDRAAELVTQITETTRLRLQAAIAKGISDGVSRETLIENIMDSGWFSADRAALIADTEIGFANSAGSLMGLMEAEDAGVEVEKEWDATDEPCPICTENQNAGPIPLNAVFPSGDDSPLGHPNCRCVLVGVTK